MADSARLQVKTSADPAVYEDVGAGNAGVPVPVVIEGSIAIDTTGLATETTLNSVLVTLGATNPNPEANTTADWLKQIKASIDNQLALLNFISDGTPTSVGQGTMAESQKVVIASDQTPLPVAGLVSASWDYLSKTEGATSNTFVFKTGGAGGTTVATLVVDYTDSTKATLLSVTKS